LWRKQKTDTPTAAHMNTPTTHQLHHYGGNNSSSSMFHEYDQSDDLFNDSYHHDGNNDNNQSSQQQQQQKQKRRRPVFVSRACTNCRKAHTKCDEQKPCSRCVRLGLSDTCHMAELQKRGRKRKTEQQQDSDEIVSNERQVNKQVQHQHHQQGAEESHQKRVRHDEFGKEIMGAATQSLLNFEQNPFDFDVLMGNHYQHQQHQHQQQQMHHHQQPQAQYQQQPIATTAATMNNNNNMSAMLPQQQQQQMMFQPRPVSAVNDQSLSSVASLDHSPLNQHLHNNNNNSNNNIIAHATMMNNNHGNHSDDDADELLEPFVIDDFFPLGQNGHITTTATPTGPTTAQHQQQSMDPTNNNNNSPTTNHVYDHNYANFLLSANLPNLAALCPSAAAVAAPVICDQLRHQALVQQQQQHQQQQQTHIIQQQAVQLAQQQQLLHLLAQKVSQSPVMDVSTSSSGSNSGLLAPQQQQRPQAMHQQQQQQQNMSMSHLLTTPVSPVHSPSYFGASSLDFDSLEHQYSSPTTSTSDYRSSVDGSSNNTSSSSLSEEDSLREQVRRLQLENEKLKNMMVNNQPAATAVANTAPQQSTDYLESIPSHIKSKTRFENQYLRFNEGEEEVGLIVSARDGTIISMNEVMRDLLGYSSEEMRTVVNNWGQILDKDFWPKQLQWAEKNVFNMEENAELSDVVFQKKGASDPPKESDLIRPKAFQTRFCYDCTSRSLLFSITKVYLK